MKPKRLARIRNKCCVVCLGVAVTNSNCGSDGFVMKTSNYHLDLLSRKPIRNAKLFASIDTDPITKADDLIKQWSKEFASSFWEDNGSAASNIDGAETASATLTTSKDDNEFQLEHEQPKLEEKVDVAKEIEIQGSDHVLPIKDFTDFTTSVDDIKQIERQETDTVSVQPTIDNTDKDDTTSTSPSVTTFTKRQETRPFPMSMIIDQEEIKHALLLSAINPTSLGVVISGGRGTGKSVIARSMRNIMPSHIRIIQKNNYNIDPEGKGGIDSFLLQELKNGEKTIDTFKTKLIPTPFVQIPLGVMEDSLIGTVDLERSLESGETVFSPGLLAKAHRGILYIDEINLLEDEVVDVLMKVLSDGEVKVEREGLSVSYPCLPLIIATYNPEEGELREHLRDRFAISLSTDATQLCVKERVSGVDNVIGYSGGLQKQSSEEAEKRLNQAEMDEQILRTRVEIARMQMSQVKIDSDQIKYLCEEAIRGGCEGQRAEIFATAVAKASAALDGRETVNAHDLQTGVMLAILPRATIYPGEVDYDENAPPPDSSEKSKQPSLSSATQPPPIMEPPPPMDSASDDKESDTEEEEPDEDKTNAEMEEDTDPNEEDQPDDESEETLAIPEEFMFGVERVKLDPKLLKFSKWTRKGRGGKRSKIFSLLRGRFVKSIFPRGGRYRLAVGATLRAAAPHQKYRRKYAIGTKKEGRPVLVEKDDFRIKKMSRKAGSLVLFVVDSSGSMALNRMNAAKGASVELLAEAYKSRDQISLISFHGDQAEVLVPPTKSMALTKNRLEAMPCGGGSPLAHALMLAAQVGLNTMKVKQAVGRVVVVCITDGRANIPLELSETGKWSAAKDPQSKDGMPSREFLKDEVLACAKKISALPDIDFVCIDTEDEFVGTGMAKEMAKTALGKYFHIDKADEIEAVSRITRQNIQRT